MAIEDKDGRLHGDEDGKFVPKDKIEAQAYDSKDNFSELKNRVSNQTGIKKLKKGIEKIKSNIRKHENKIKHPELEYPEWDSFPDYKKKGSIEYWKKEIDRYKREINKKEREIEDFYGR